jgi:hypothetical protein
LPYECEARLACAYASSLAHRADAFRVRVNACDTLDWFMSF